MPLLRRIRRALGNRAFPVFIAACVVPLACATVPDPQPLRLMTYNIAAGGGDLDAIADVIRATAPDIVGLQEVDVRWSARSSFADQAAALGSALGMHVRFGPIYSLPDTGSTDRNAGSANRNDSSVDRNTGSVDLNTASVDRNDSSATDMTREFGLAILSRAPILEFTNHVIPRLSTQDSATEPVPMPGFIEAVIGVAGVRLHVFNTHLDYRADPRVRELQVAAMMEVISSRTGPVLLMGDLNARPDARELRPLLTRFADAWSIRSDAGATYPAAAPDRRIDYILLSDHFRVTDTHVSAALASDHRAVVADVLLPSGGAVR